MVLEFSKSIPNCSSSILELNVEWDKLISRFDIIVKGLEAIDGYCTPKVIFFSSCSRDRTTYGSVVGELKAWFT